MSIVFNIFVVNQKTLKTAFFILSDIIKRDVFYSLFETKNLRVTYAQLNCNRKLALCRICTIEDNGADLNDSFIY